MRITINDGIYHHSPNEQVIIACEIL
jgi:hypothetical protein